MAATKWASMAILALLSLALSSALRDTPTPPPSPFDRVEKADKPKFRVIDGLGGGSSPGLDVGEWTNNGGSGSGGGGGGGGGTGGNPGFGGAPAYGHGGGWGKGSGSNGGGGGGGGGGGTGGIPGFGGVPGSGGSGGGYGWGGGYGGDGEFPPGMGEIPGFPPIPGMGEIPGFPPIPGMGPGDGSYPGNGGYPGPRNGLPPFNEPLRCTPNSCYEKYGSLCDQFGVLYFDYTPKKRVSTMAAPEMRRKSPTTGKMDGLNNGAMAAGNSEMNGGQPEQMISAMAPERN